MNTVLIVLAIIIVLGLLGVYTLKRKGVFNKKPQIDSHNNENVIPPPPFEPIEITPTIQQKDLKKNLTIANLSNGGSGLSYIVPTDGKNDLIRCNPIVNPLSSGQNQSFSGIFGADFCMFLTNNTDFDCKLHRFVNGVEKESIPLGKAQTAQVFGDNYTEKEVIKFVLKPL